VSEGRVRQFVVSKGDRELEVVGRKAIGPLVGEALRE